MPGGSARLGSAQPTSKGVRVTLVTGNGSTHPLPEMGSERWDLCDSVSHLLA